MSRPPFVQLPPRVRADRLATRRGEFAVLDAEPAPGLPRRGTVLLVPGFTGSKEDFIALLAPLADAGYRAVAVDGRGQHETPGPPDPSGYRIGALAQDVLAQVDAVSEPVHLVGHSLGGLLCRGAVLRDPAAAHTLTLLSSGPGRCAPWPRWRLRALRVALPLLGPDRLWRLLHLGTVNARRPADPDPVADFLRRRWGGTLPQQLHRTARQLRHEPDRVDRLAATGTPVHVLSGERDGAWPLPLMDEMAVRLGARRTVITGAGHSPNAERPAATAAALLDFFRDVDGQRGPAVQRDADAHDPGDLALARTDTPVGTAGASPVGAGPAPAADERARVTGEPTAEAVGEPPGQDAGSATGAEPVG